MSKTHLFTSESVSKGHPDKVADQISDAILDAMLAQDSTSRVAVETLVTTGMALIAGEVTTKAYVEIPRLVREVIREIGYTDADMRFDADSCAVMVALDQQSPDISQGVDRLGAGDQGMMFGFACQETEELMPLPIHLAHRLMERQALVRERNIIPGLRPDAKSQVVVVYDGLKPVGVDTVLISTQHDNSWTDHQDDLSNLVSELLIRPVLGDWWSDDIRILVNPTGCFEIGGPHGDCGLTGRKIIVDTYGGRARHGGGAFSGKDPTKVDRSAAYMARYVAKNVVAAGLAEVCELQLSYAIGVVDPTSVMLECFGTESVPLDKLSEAIRETFPLTPQGIIEVLNLRQPIYWATSRFGHFGRGPIGTEEPLTFFPWEKTDRVEDLLEAVG